MPKSREIRESRSVLIANFGSIHWSMLLKALLLLVSIGLFINYATTLVELGLSALPEGRAYNWLRYGGPLLGSLILILVIAGYMRKVANQRIESSFSVDKVDYDKRTAKADLVMFLSQARFVTDEVYEKSEPGTGITQSRLVELAAKSDSVNTFEQEVLKEVRAFPWIMNLTAIEVLWDAQSRFNVKKPGRIILLTSEESYSDKDCFVEVVAALFPEMEVAFAGEVLNDQAENTINVKDASHTFRVIKKLRDSQQLSDSVIFDITSGTKPVSAAGMIAAIDSENYYMQYVEEVDGKKQVSLWQSGYDRGDSRHPGA